MKTFFEEYGLSTIMACVIMFLLVMASPVGGAINTNLKSTSTNMKDTGTAVEAKAGKSIKNLAGEEDIPDGIFVGYNSSTKTLIFSHSDDEDSPMYLDCNIKYGDVSELGDSAYRTWQAHQGSGNSPWDDNSKIPNSITIENKIKPKTMCYWFYSLAKATEINGINNINTSQCTNMNGTFSNCQKITSLDLSSWDTSKVTTMEYMFNYCYALETLNVSKFKTQNVTNMGSMFRDSYRLKSLDLSSFNTLNVEKMDFMFFECTALKTLDVSSFNTPKVTSMSNMFNKCKSITSLDLTLFNTRQDPDIRYMFCDAKVLTTITYGPNFVEVYKTYNDAQSWTVFAGCPANKPTWWH